MAAISILHPTLGHGHGVKKDHASAGKQIPPPSGSYSGRSLRSTLSACEGLIQTTELKEPVDHFDGFPWPNALRFLTQTSLNRVV